MSSPKVLLLVILALIGFAAQSQTIIPAGYVSGNWDETGSPYLVQGDIVIHEDSSLNITENVIIEFADTASLEVFGHISAIGEIGNYIFFTSDDTWQGIHIFENQNLMDSCIFSSCIFEFCVHNDSVPGAAISIENRDKVVFHDAWFNNNYAQQRGGAMFLFNSDIVIRHSYFQSNSAIDTASSQGGAIYILDSSPQLFGNYFTANDAINGACVYCLNSSPRIDQCSFVNNVSRGGGGAIVFHQSGNPLITDCLFQDNGANGSGGAIAFLEDIQVRLENCTFNQNGSGSDTYLADGGAILITPYDNAVDLVNCEFSMNQAEDYGGALYATSPTNIIGCLFHGNNIAYMLEGRGGAVYVGETSMRIINSTLSGNDSWIGSSIFCEDADLAMINSILWDDSPGFTEPTIYLNYIEEPPALFVDHCDIEGGLEAVTGTVGSLVHWGTGNIDLNPGFLELGNDYSLAWNSICINAGRTDTLQLLIPYEDIAGNPRIVNGEIDMGCYEYQEPINVAELSGKQEFIVFPNPTRDYINIKNTSGTDFMGQVFLSDLSGRRVFEKTVNIQQYSSFRMSVSSLQGGMYILNLVSAKSRIARKLLVTGR